jgi:hypothetical protein
MKRQIVKALVYRVTIDKRRELNVDLRMDLLKILEQVSQKNIMPIRQV